MLLLLRAFAPRKASTEQELTPARRHETRRAGLLRHGRVEQAVRISAGPLLLGGAQTTAPYSWAMWAGVMKGRVKCCETLEVRGLGRADDRLRAVTIYYSAIVMKGSYGARGCWSGR